MYGKMSRRGSSTQSQLFSLGRYTPLSKAASLQRTPVFGSCSGLACTRTHEALNLLQSGARKLALRMHSVRSMGLVGMDGRRHSGTGSWTRLTGTCVGLGHSCKCLLEDVYGRLHLERTIFINFLAGHFWARFPPHVAATSLQTCSGAVFLL